MLQMWGRDVSVDSAAGVDWAAVSWICDTMWAPCLFLVLLSARSVTAPGLGARDESLP